jgi:hypothetical protein
VALVSGTRMKKAPESTGDQGPVELLLNHLRLEGRQFFL